MIKEIETLVGGFLSALLFFFGTIGISFSWFTVESINAFIVVLSAFITLVINIYAIYKNTYVITKKARMQKEELKNKGLKIKDLLSNGVDKKILELCCVRLRSTKLYNKTKLKKRKAKVCLSFLVLYKINEYNPLMNMTI